MQQSLSEWILSLFSVPNFAPWRTIRSIYHMAGQNGFVCSTSDEFIAQIKQMELEGKIERKDKSQEIILTSMIRAV